ncbi:MAG: flagellar brake protein [bacterium]|nr:flagellar brake protein [Betaproteobacteria bacterium]
MPLQPLRKDDLQIGKPIPYSVYDKDRVLLLGHGCVIESDFVLQSLREQGMFSDDSKPQGKGLLYRPSVLASQLAANEANERRGLAAENLPVTKAAPEMPEDTVVGFLETTLRMGDPLQLRFDDGTADRYPVRLIGAADRRSVLVSHPVVNGAMIYLKDGQPLTVKALRGKYAYSFDTSVLKSQLAPFPYLHLTFPNQVRCASIRKAHRIQLNAVASVGRAGQRARVACNMKDLSIAGTLVHVPRELAVVGTAVEVAFRLQVSGEPVTFEMPGTIRNAREADDSSSRYRACGLEFSDLDRPQRNALQLFIYERMLSEL